MRGRATMTTTNLLWFAGGCCFVFWLMFRCVVRLDEGTPLDTDFWLWCASTALGAFAMACFAFAFVLLVTA